jgi:CubicO group peptidase (beta-lactamase class C family)
MPAWSHDLSERAHMIRLVNRCCLCLILCVLPALLRADDVDDYVRSRMQKLKIPGLSLAVVRDGKIVKAEGYGMANLELQVPATPHSVYEIGSLSKQFTATVVMMLVEEGKLTLEGTISSFLPGLPPGWREVTLRQLLTHTSGIPDFETVIGYDSYRNIYTDESLLKTVRDSAMDFPPGERWSYSNTGYLMLAMLLEKVLGRPYPDIIRERIFQPLGMAESRDTDPRTVIPHRAAGYALTGKIFGNRDPMQPSACKGAGTLVSTVLDLARWDSVLSTDRLLRKSSREAMTTPVLLKDGTTYPYGFGWFLQPLRQGHRTISHTGMTAGFTTLLYRYVDDHLSVIILANRYEARIGAMALSVAGFYVPALAPPVYAAIPDSEDAVTALARALYGARARADSLWQESWFAPEFWKEVKPYLKVFRDDESPSGALVSMTLVERIVEGGLRSYRYRVVYEKTSLLGRFTLNTEEKIVDLGEAEE